LHYTLSLLLCLLLNCLVVFQSKSQELTLAYALENYNFQKIFDDFSEKTHVQLKIKNFKNNELKSALIQGANMRQLPDIVIVPSDFVGLSELGFSTIPESWLVPELSTESLQSAKVAGDYKGIPIIFGNHLLLYYNKSLVQTPATDWQTLIQQKQSLPENTTLIGWNYYEMYWFIPFLGAFGEFPYVDGKVNLNTAGMKQALSWYKQLADDKIVDKLCDYECNLNAFISEQQAYTINGSWAFNHFKEKLGDNLGIAMLPQYKGKQMRPYFSSHVIAFPNHSLESSTEKKAKLKKFAEFFQQKRAQAAIWHQLKSIPTNKQIISELTNKADPNLQVIFQQLAQSEPMPNERNMAIIWEAMLKGVNRYSADIFDNHKAAEYMQYITERSMQNEP